jgi:hypothetical protein
MTTGAAHSKTKVIGWREWVSLPELGILALKVKVDSGARTSALHATKIRYLEKLDGQTWVSFLVTKQRRPRKTVRVRAPLVEQRLVKSSLGHASVRPVIRTAIQLGSELWPIEITLVNRDPMGFRMLLGRRAIKGRYLIHPTRSFIQSEPREDL